MKDILIEPFDPHALTETDWLAVCGLLNPFRHEIDVSLMLLDAAEARRRYTSAEQFYRTNFAWARQPDGALVGWLEAGRFMESDRNGHLLEFEIIVAAPFRRQGIGSALLQQVVALAESEGRTLLDSHANSRLPAVLAFLLRAGGAIGMQHVTNELALADVDQELMQRWIERATERAEDYALVAIPSPLSSEMLEPLAAMLRLMNTAPLEDLRVDDIQWTAADVREIDDNLLRRGGTRFILAACHRSSGEFVGYTELIGYGFQPQFLWQEDTVVAPEHRHRGLGRWLKAANLRRVMAERPEAQRIRTGNAGSNTPMLAINHEMGFRPIFTNAIVQIPTAAARAYLTERAS